MTTKSGEWHAIGGIVDGATHLRQGRVCQDALYFRAEKGFVVAAVADGHGSDSCPYSDEGAKAAVNIAAEFLQEIMPGIHAHKDIRLPKLLEAKWKAEIEKIHAEMSREPAEPFPYILYGTTLIALAVAKDFVFVLKIGDGDILMIDETGAWEVLAAPQKVGEDTESLCLDDAWTHVRTQIIPFSGKKPAMFLLSTDGYANSFSDLSGFLKAGTDFFSLWQEDGLDFIAENLPDWLRKSSDKGSGDDIAMVLLAYEKFQNKGV